MGVDYNLFWHLNPAKLRAFIEADRIKKREIEAILYLQGRYAFDATTLALANGFRKKNEKAHGWIEEPYLLVPYTPEEEAARAEAERKKAIAFFNSMMLKDGGKNNG